MLTFVSFVSSPHSVVYHSVHKQGLGDVELLTAVVLPEVQVFWDVTLCACIFKGPAAKEE
jgi:hypothetical protein